ncbi:hypothetical protein ACSSVW_003578, partial [Pseudoalteromonas sp. MBR-15]
DATYFNRVKEGVVLLNSSPESSLTIQLS